jgi:hypothetical protein
MDEVTREILAYSDEVAKLRAQEEMGALLSTLMLLTDALVENGALRQEQVDTIATLLERQALTMSTAGEENTAKKLTAVAEQLRERP